MAFDADSFMTSVTDEANETKIIPCPVGEYNGMITKIEPKSGTSDTKGLWASLNVSVEVSDPKITEVTGFDKRTVRGSVFLDLNEAGKLAAGPGKNVQLGRLRAAVGQNVAGAPWSPNMLVGQPVRINVTNRPSPKDPTIVYDDIGAYLTPQ